MTVKMKEIRHHTNRMYMNSRVGVHVIGCGSNNHYQRLFNLLGGNVPLSFNHLSFIPLDRVIIVV